MARFQTSKSISECADKLRQLGYKACSLANNAPQSRSAPTVDWRNLTLRALLNRIVGENPGYTWRVVDDGLINIFPVESVLNSSVAPIRVKGKSVWRILREDLELEKRGITVFAELVEEERPRISLRVGRKDLRGVLNEIVRRLGRTAWQITGQPGAYYLMLTGVEDQGERATTPIAESTARLSTR